ncbi:MAG: PEP-CTERM sorting domain-containing protein, partial [Betaproteobacteria bacterium]|nr:PEP-CTERM sorting domain-containing protein [Betaproteobacteria bacterium]
VGTTTVSAGALNVASGGSIASSATTVNSGGTLNVAGTAGAITNSGSTVIQSGGTSGALTINGGTATVNGTSGNTTVNSGGTLKGSGTVGALTIASGGTLAVGNSPGTMNATSAVWNGGGRYQVEVKNFPLSLQEGATSSNFLGGAGTNWDYLNVATTLTINATSGNQFIIDVASLLADNSSGNASGFLPQYDYTMAIATAAGGISGFDSSYFGFDLSKFTNSRDYAPWMSHGNYAPGNFNVSLSADSKTLNLNYARAIPEPSSASLLVLGLATVLAKSRRCRREFRI